MYILGNQAASMSKKDKFCYTRSIMKQFYLRAATFSSTLFATALLASQVHAAPFAVYGPTPHSTHINMATEYVASFESGLATIERCRLSVDGVDQGDMVLTGTSVMGTAKKIVTINSAGSHLVRATCFDDDAPSSVYSEESVTVTADASAPTLTAYVLAPSSPTAGASFTLQTNYSDTGSGLNTCGLIVDGAESGLLTLSNGAGSTSGTATFTGTISTVGSHNLTINCFDRSGNFGTRAETVVFASLGDTTAPVVNNINPTTATVGSAVNITASFSDSVGVVSCNLSVNGSLVGSMDRSGTVSGTASRSHSFSGTGSTNVQVSCSDSAGNISNSSQTVTVTTSPTSGPYTGHLLKLACPAGFVDVNHPCKAVYYIGMDGRRHAFPNSRIYFTWYSTFDAVIDVDNATMASFALGNNVNYRPGIRMVKFTTVNKVYAVGRYGQLRWVTSEGLATSFYGSTWNTKIDDLSDAFYTDYNFGADINSTASYSPSGEAASVTTIDANLR